MSYLDKLLAGVAVEWKPLGEISEIYGGLTGKDKADFEDGNASYISYKNIFDNIEVNFSKLEKVKVATSENQHAVKYGDVLFTGSSETAVEAGMSSSVTADIEGDVYLNSFSFGLRFNDNIELLPEFSKYLFRSHFMRLEISKTASGVTRFNISKQRFKKILVPIPPIEIQKEIVRILDKFSTLTAELTAELQARKKQYNYYRDQLLNSEKNEVELKPLGEIGEVRMCKRILKEQTSDIGEIPFYKIGTFGKDPDAYISKELFDEYKARYNYPRIGDVLISASGTIGRSVIFDGIDAYFQDSNIVWIENNEKQVLNKYLFYCYQIAKWEIAEGGTIQRLYNDNLKKTKIPVPYPNDTKKSLEEQKRIVSILDKFDTLTTSISEGLPKEIELRQKQYEYYRNMLLTFPKDNIKA